uniref:Vpu protein n=1 Tax=Simian immunodeficiency virus TaxID=11723 RepID=A4UDH7_SIV|nr:vpu protein [Simian immunodeficiency virus]
MNWWWFAAAVVTAIYFVIALVAFVLAYQRWCQPQKGQVEVNVIRLLEEGDTDSGIFEDAEDGSDDQRHGFLNPAFEL